MNNTYFILSRNIFESAIWRDDPHILKLFIYLIGNARHSRKDKVYPKIKIKRGELVTSLMQISEDNEYVLNGIIKKWSRQKVSRMLKLLEDQNYIKRVSDTYGTHINICNYDIYQSPDTYKTDTDGTVVERLWNGCGQGVGTNNNVNNGKNGNNGKNDKNDKKEIYKEKFEVFRKKYPGTKRGLDTEYDNFIKKNKKDIIELLLPAIENQIEVHNEKIKQDKFCPEWKHLQTWINQKCWEEETEVIEKEKSIQERIAEGRRLHELKHNTQSY